MYIHDNITCIIAVVAVDDKHCHFSEDKSKQDSNQNSNDSTNEAKYHRFNQKLLLNGLIFCTQCFSDTDFFGSLGDGHQHDIHYADAPTSRLMPAMTAMARLMVESISVMLSIRLSMLEAVAV